MSKMESDHDIADDTGLLVKMQREPIIWDGGFAWRLCNCCWKWLKPEQKQVLLPQERTPSRLDSWLAEKKCVCAMYAKKLCMHGVHV